MMMIDKVCSPSACCHNLLGTITLIILDDDVNNGHKIIKIILLYQYLFRNVNRDTYTITLAF